MEKFLRDKLKLELSKEKTVITNIKKKPIHFLGLTYKVVKQESTRKGTITRTHPNPERLQRKIRIN